MRSTSSRRLVVAVRATLLTLFLAVTPALSSQEPQTPAGTGVDPSDLKILTVENRTGNEISYLFVSPADADSWGADILGPGVSLPTENERDFYVSFPADVTSWDILAVDENRDAYIIWNAPFEPADQIVVTIAPGDFESGYDLPPLATVRFTNSTTRDIWFAFLTPAGAPAVGVDVLNVETILEPRETFAVLVPVGSEPVRYELLAVDVRGRGFARSIDLSATRMLRRFSIEE